MESSSKNNRRQFQKEKKSFAGFQSSQPKLIWKGLFRKPMRSIDNAYVRVRLDVRTSPSYTGNILIGRRSGIIRWYNYKAPIKTVLWTAAFPIMYTVSKIKIVCSEPDNNFVSHEINFQ